MVKYCVICKEKVELEDRWIPSCSNKHSGRYCHNCLHDWIGKHQTCPECQGACQFPNKLVLQKNQTVKKKKPSKSPVEIANARLVELEYHDREYGTKLHRAVALDHTVQPYLSEKYLFLTPDNLGRVPLKVAIEKRRTGSMKLFLEAQCPLYPTILHDLLNKKRELKAQSVIFFEIIKSILIRDDLNLHVIDDQADTPLHLATRLLVKKWEKRQNSWDWDWRYYESRMITIIEMLLNRGASVSALNTKGDTPFHELLPLIAKIPDASNEDILKLFKMFIKKNADLCLDSSKEENLMSRICFSGDLSWFDALPRKKMLEAFKKYFDPESNLTRRWNWKKDYRAFTHQLFQKEIVSPQHLAIYFADLEDRCNQEAFEEVVIFYHEHLKAKPIRKTIGDGEDEKIRLANYATLKKYVKK